MGARVGLLITATTTPRNGNEKHQSNCTLVCAIHVLICKITSSLSGSLQANSQTPPGQEQVFPTSHTASPRPNRTPHSDWTNRAGHDPISAP